MVNNTNTYIAAEKDAYTKQLQDNIITIERQSEELLETKQRVDTGINIHIAKPINRDAMIKVLPKVLSA